MDGLILPGGNQGTIPPEFQGRLQAMPIIPQAVKDAQKAYIEDGKSIVENLNFIIDNSEDMDHITFSRALKWLIKGMLPLDI